VTKPLWREVELQSATVKKLWHQWVRLKLKDGLLTHTGKMLYGSPDRLQIIVPRSHWSEVIHVTHAGLTGGHLGCSKTENQLARNRMECTSCHGAMEV